MAMFQALHHPRARVAVPAIAPRALTGARIIDPDTRAAGAEESRAGIALDGRRSVKRISHTATPSAPAPCAGSRVSPPVPPTRWARWTRLAVALGAPRAWGSAGGAGTAAGSWPWSSAWVTHRYCGTTGTRRAHATLHHPHGRASAIAVQGSASRAGAPLSPRARSRPRARGPKAPNAQRPRAAPGWLRGGGAAWWGCEKAIMEPSGRVRSRSERPRLHLVLALPGRGVLHRCPLPP